MKEKQLTRAQVLELQPYERYFRQATEAAWCSYPGQAAINKMLDVWATLTGTPYAYKPGCPNCLMNLVRDMGTIYFAQKDSVAPAEVAEKPAEEETLAEAAVVPAEKKPAKSGGKRARK